jgi:hypothetical protein
MGWLRILTISLSVSFIMSCGSDEPPPKKTVFEPLLQKEERAREVQKAVDANAEATRKAVDTQERGDTAP